MTDLTGALSRRRRDARHRGRTERATLARRGFSLLELVVVAAVGSVLFLVLIRWVLALGAASSATLDNASAQRAADVARDAFATDVANAVPCAPEESSPLRTISPDKVTFTVRGTGTPADPTRTDQVTWQLRPAGHSWVLTRTLELANEATMNRCTVKPGVTQTWEGHLVPVQADRILAGDASTRPAFYTITDGRQVTDPAQAWGSCAAGQSADRCFAGALGVNWFFSSPVDGAAPAAVARAYPFALSAEGLS